MTRFNSRKITKAQYFDIVGKLHKPPEYKEWSFQKNDDVPYSPNEILDRIQTINQVLKQKGSKLNAFTGKGLVSFFLPHNFIYEKKNGADPDQPVVKIWKGVLYEGALDKSVLGSSHNSIIQVINKEYGPTAASHFVDCIQYVANDWLLIHAFSIGLGDCLLSDPSKQQEIRKAIGKFFMEAENMKKTTNHPGIREMRINASLNKAKDVGLRIAKESLKNTNNFLDTVTSGSKGDYFNIAQITGLLGQQNLLGKRVPLNMNHGRRTLPHYPFGELPPDMEYESRGFIASSFIKGLNPREFYFHSMSGREGISDKLVSLTADCLIFEGKQCYLLVLLCRARWLISGECL